MLSPRPLRPSTPRFFFAQLGPIDRAGTAQQLWGVAQAKYRPAHRFRGHFRAFSLTLLITMLVSEAPKTLNPKEFFAQLGPIDSAGTAQQLWGVVQAKYRPAHRFRGPIRVSENA